MIGRIANTAEVEQGIREAAAARADRLFPQPTMNEMALLESWAHADVGNVITKDARPKGIGENLSSLDRVALHWLYVCSFADAMQSRCEDEEERRVETLAAAVLCRQCAQPFLHANHGFNAAPERWTTTATAILHTGEAIARGEADHPFTCPHGE